MAKDLTFRGGARPNSGPLPKDYDQKVLEGKAEPRMPFMPNIPSIDMPGAAEWLNQKQKDGEPLSASEIYAKTKQWITERSAEEVVPDMLIQQYAMTFARWMQVEEAISKYGMIARHPTSKAPVKSPFIEMETTYMKNSLLIWMQIQARVGERGVTARVIDPLEEMLNAQDE